MKKSFCFVACAAAFLLSGSSARTQEGKPRTDGLHVKVDSVRYRKGGGFELKLVGKVNYPKGEWVSVGINPWTIQLRDNSKLSRTPPGGRLSRRVVMQPKGLFRVTFTLSANTYNYRVVVQNRRRRTAGKKTTDGAVPFSRGLRKKISQDLVDLEKKKDGIRNLIRRMRRFQEDPEKKDERRPYQRYSRELGSWTARTIIRTSGMLLGRIQGMIEERAFPYTEEVLRNAAKHGDLWAENQLKIAERAGGPGTYNPPPQPPVDWDMWLHRVDLVALQECMALVLSLSIDTLRQIQQSDSSGTTRKLRKQQGKLNEFFSDLREGSLAVAFEEFELTGEVGEILGELDEFLREVSARDLTAREGARNQLDDFRKRLQKAEKKLFGEKVKEETEK